MAPPIAVATGLIAALLGVDRRIGVRRRRPVDLDGLVHRHAEADLLLRAAEARMTEADRPRIDDFAEVQHRAVGVRRRTLASELVEAVAEAMSFVAELLGEAAGIEVRAPRAVLVNRAAVGELRPAFFVEAGSVP